MIESKNRVWSYLLINRMKERVNIELYSRLNTLIFWTWDLVDYNQWLQISQESLRVKNPLKMDESENRILRTIEVT